MHVTLSLLDRSLKLVDALADVDDPAGIPPVMLPGLAELVPCDVVTYNEIGLSPARVRYVDYPSGILDNCDATVFARHLHEHPLLNHYKKTGDGGPAKISDFLDSRRFHSLGLYSEFYALTPVEHQMAVSLSAPGQWVVGIAFDRAKGDFTELERDLLRSLHGPLVAAVRRAGRRHEAKTALNGVASNSAQLSQLTEREMQTLGLVANGHTNVAIGHALNISPRTVAKHLEHIYTKLAVNNRAAAIARAAPIRDGRF